MLEDFVYGTLATLAFLIFVGFVIAEEIEYAAKKKIRKR